MADETLVCDCETDGFLSEMTRLWLLQMGTADGDEVDVYADQPGYRPIAEGLQRLREARRLVFHNGIGFDFKAINKVYPGTIRREQLWDTLVAARLRFPDERDHQLRSWGRRIGVLKGEYKGDFKAFSTELAEYAPQDIVVGRALYHKVREVDAWGSSMALEMDVAWAIDAQERRGFTLDVAAAQALDASLRGRLAELKAELQIAFPPIPHVLEWTPQASNKKFGYVKGQPTTKRWTEEFNPASRHHVARRLMAMGWKPTKMTPEGQPAVDEAVLSSLRYPEAKLLGEYYKDAKKLAQVSDGKTGWLKLVRPTGRVHGRVNPNGAVTGRMSHSGPNLGNVDTDPAMRSCWIAGAGLKLVGCDADGVQARMLAHYLRKYDGGAFQERLINGTKEARTDVHSANLKALIDYRLIPGIVWDDKGAFKIGREGAKRCLYAYLFGAQDKKLGNTLREEWRNIAAVIPGFLATCPKGSPVELGKMVRASLMRSITGLKSLSDQIAKAVRGKGYLGGLDGRHLFIRSAHAALNTLLQGGEAVVMKKALQIMTTENCIRTEEFERRWWFVANVHDEVQMEAEPDIAEDLGKAFANCIAKAGRDLNVRCPLAGSYSVGNNWSETH